MLDFKVQTFLKVCETMNLTTAARKLHLTQPAVTKQIQALEEYYGVKLFQYQNRVLSLTSDGQFLKQMLLSVNREMLRAKQDIVRKRERTRIKIGATLSIGNYSLVSSIPALLKVYPDIDVSLSVADTKILLEKLDRNELDFIFCEGNFAKNRYEYSLIKEVPMAVFCGADYEIGDIHRISDLLSHTLILREKGSGTREIFENYLRLSGYTINDFKNYHEVNHSEVILKLLAADVGISVLYETVGAAMIRDGVLKKIPLDDYKLVHEFNLIWNKTGIPDKCRMEYMEFLCQNIIQGMI